MLICSDSAEVTMDDLTRDDHPPSANRQQSRNKLHVSCVCQLKVVEVRPKHRMNGKVCSAKKDPKSFER